MRVCGIDPSSSFCGVALTINGAPSYTDVWSRKDRCDNDSAPARLVNYYAWLNSWVAINQPDMACVEFLSVERNAQATRVISHYQAASVIVCKRAGLVVVESRVSTARKHVLGNGGLSKDAAWDAMRKRYPDNDYGHKTRRGLDRMDAMVLALAGPAVAET